MENTNKTKNFSKEKEEIKRLVVMKMQMSVLSILFSCCLLFISGSIVKAQTEPKKVLMHYMRWFGSGSTSYHWGHGQPRTPSIGYYKSNSWATQMCSCAETYCSVILS